MVDPFGLLGPSLLVIPYLFLYSFRVNDWLQAMLGLPWGASSPCHLICRLRLAAFELFPVPPFHVSETLLFLVSVVK